MQGKSFFWTALMGVTIVIIVVPWIEACLADGSINTNQIILNGASTIKGVFQRQLVERTEQ